MRRPLREILNGDAPLYGGSGQGNLGGVESEPVSWHARPHSVVVNLPPLAVAVFRYEPSEGTPRTGTEAPSAGC